MNLIQESNKPGDSPPAASANNGASAENSHGEQHGHPRVSTATSDGTGRRLAIAAAIVLLVLGIGFGIALFLRSRHEHEAQAISSDATDAMPAVDVVTVRSTAGTYPLVLPGQTAGWFESTIYARVDGYVGKWFSDIGDRVHAGQVLATIETPELDQQLGAAEARVNASTAQVKVATANESIAKITFNRWWDSPKGVVSEQERQEKKAQYDSAVAQLESAKAQLQLAQADVDRLKAMETFKQVVAPYDGVITGRHIDIGDLITAGSASSTSSLYTVAQANVIRTFIDVPQKMAADMVVGLEATAASDQFPGRSFRGKVARSTRSIDPQSRTQRTEVDIPNKDLVLLPGMYVQVTFELKQQGLLQVPAASILFRPGGLQVAVVDDENKVSFRPITVAKDDGDTVELVFGVKENERVALNISNYIVAGEKVTPVDVDKEMGTPPSTPPPPAPDVEAGGPPADADSAARYTPRPESGLHPPSLATAPSGPVHSDAPPLVPGQISEPASAPVAHPKVDTPASGAAGGSGVP